MAAGRQLLAALITLAAAAAGSGDGDGRLSAAARLLREEILKRPCTFADIGGAPPSAERFNAELADRPAWLPVCAVGAVRCTSMRGAISP